MVHSSFQICWKKLVVTSVLLELCCAHLIWSQPKKVVFNFETKKFCVNELEKLQESDFYQLHITNLNGNLYKVSMDTKDTISEQKVNVPTFGGFDLDNLSKVIAGITSFSAELTGATVSLSGEEFELKGKKSTKSSKPLSKQEQVRNTAILDAKKLIENTKKKLLGLKEKIFKLKVDIDELVFQTEYYIRKSDVEFESQIAGSGLHLSTFNMSTLINAIGQKRAALILLNSEIGTEHGKYIDDMKPHLLTLVDNASLKASDESINKSFEEFNKTVGAALDSINADKMGAVISRIILRENNRKYEYLSPPIQYSGGVGILKFTITPRSDDGLLQSYSTSIKFPLRNKPVTVLGAGFYTALLKNEVLSVAGTKNGTDTSYSFVKEDDRKGEIGVYASINRALPIGKKNTFLNITVGPALSLSDKVRPRIIVGSGLSFGKRNMLTIGVGGITGYVDRRSKLLETVQTFNVKPESGIVSKLGFGGYVNIGYQYNF